MIFYEKWGDELIPLYSVFPTNEMSERFFLIPVLTIHPERSFPV